MVWRRFPSYAIALSSFHHKKSHRSVINSSTLVIAIPLFLIRFNSHFSNFSSHLKDLYIFLSHRIIFFNFLDFYHTKISSILVSTTFKVIHIDISYGNTTQFTCLFEKKTMLTLKYHVDGVIDGI